MSTPIIDGGPAFANAGGGTWVYPPQKGMTLRDYFAGQALVGVLANPSAQGVAAADQAGYAYFLADAMIAAR